MRKTTLESSIGSELDKLKTAGGQLRDFRVYSPLVEEKVQILEAIYTRKAMILSLLFFCRSLLFLVVG